MRFALGVGLLGLAAMSVIAFGVGMVLTGFTHPLRTTAAVAAPITPPPNAAMPGDLVPPSVGNPPVLPAGSNGAPAPAPAQSGPPQQQAPPVRQPRGTPPPFRHHPSPPPPG